MPKHLHVVLDLEECEPIGIALPVDAAGSTASADDLKRNVDLVGTKNGVNLVYTTPDLFVLTPFVEVVNRNGVTQREGAGNDYTRSESGGAGTGFDTITLLNDAPLSWEQLTIDYIVKP